MPKPVKLIDITMNEISAVEHGANQSDGWMLMKARREAAAEWFTKNLLAQPVEVQEKIFELLDSVHPTERALTASKFRPGATSIGTVVYRD